MKKYIVIPVALFVQAVQNRLKNYGQNVNAWFIEDTPDTVRRIRRKDNGNEYVILKPTALGIERIRELFANHSENAVNKFQRIYTKTQFRNFLQQEFE